jgi:Alpha-aminoadipate carrier protein LysW-like, globular domain
MSRRHDMDEEETNYAVCEICDSDIAIDFYSEPGDTVSCDDCGAYYTLQSINPIRISLLDGDEDDESYLDLNFDD